MKPPPFSRLGILGESPATRNLLERVQQAAPHWDAILLIGERGTGKELLARAIHQLGPSRNQRLVTVDCAALHPATIESALFGHERGAFTGAVRQHIGLFEQAHEGALFLDEISHLPLDIQGRFLRFLEEGTMRRIGAKETRKIRTRVIAASNRDLAHEAAQGRFLPDLHDRLNVLRLPLPPLRMRTEDILLLTRHYLGDDFARIDGSGREFIENYHWPGNIRELRNLCRRIVVFAPQGIIDKIRVESLIDKPLRETRADSTGGTIPLATVC